MRYSILVLLLISAPLALAAADAKPTPPLRTRAEVEAALSKAPVPDPKVMRQIKKIVLVATVKDHGPGEHDYPRWQTNWTKLLSQLEGVSVTTAWKWPNDEQFAQANLLVFYYWNHNWTDEAFRQLDAFFARGGGVVVLHSSCIADNEPDIQPLADRIGLASHPKRSKYRHGELDLKFTVSADHPLTVGLPRTIHFVDETYWPLFNATNQIGRTVETIATAEEEGKDWPMVWTYRKDKGRVFG